MPRGQKSKLRARDKRLQARGEAQCLKDAQDPEAQEVESTSCVALLEHADTGASVAWLHLKFPEPPSTASVTQASSSKPSGKGAKGRRPERATFFKVKPSPALIEHQLLQKKAGLVMHYLLYRYKMKEPMRKSEMLKIIHKNLRLHYPEILKLATDHIEVFFGLEVKETKPGSGSYIFTKTEDPNHVSPFSSLSFPQNGLVMPLLSMIFLNGNSASEEEIWQFLSVLGIYKGKEHLIFGNLRQFFTKDLIDLKYLAYRQVPGSDPPCHRYMWGPRSHAETSKIKVLEFLAKFHETVPSAFPLYYAEALSEEKERVRAKAAANRAPPSVFAESLSGDSSD